MWKLCDVSERICSFWGFLRCSCMKYYLYCFYSFVFLQSKFICGAKGLFSHMRHPAESSANHFDLPSKTFSLGMLYEFQQILWLWFLHILDTRFFFCSHAFLLLIVILYLYLLEDEREARKEIELIFHELSAKGSDATSGWTKTRAKEFYTFARRRNDVIF